jgi:hypothetical protein
MALLVVRKLFTQKEVFCCHGSGWAQTELQEAHNITQECQQYTGELHEVTEQVQRSRHREGILLKYR